MDTASIRSMREEDIPNISKWMVQIPLWQRYNLTEAKAIAQFQRALQNEELLLVADAAGHPACGFGWLLPGGAFGRSMYLRLIGVHPGCAGMGIGGTLLATVEREARHTGQDLFLLVSDFNTSAQRFYQRHGYTQIGAIPAYVLPDVTELIYRKRLTAE
jgi:ribosomal protein S18 acetylase RimI-like enzyme